MALTLAPQDRGFRAGSAQSPTPRQSTRGQGHGLVAASCPQSDQEWSLFRLIELAMVHRIVAADTYETSGFRDPLERIALHSSSQVQAFHTLFRHLLFYDEVLIPANDLIVLVPLLQRFPHSALQELFYRGLFRVINVRGRPVFGATATDVASPGDFAVITSFDSQRRPKGDLALPEAIDKFKSACRAERIKTFDLSVLTKHHLEVNLQDGPLDVCGATRRLLRSRPDIADWVGARNRNEDIELPQADAHTLRTLDVESLLNPTNIDKCLSLFHAVILRSLANVAEARDISTHTMVDAASHLVHSRGTAVSVSESRLLELEQVPDIGLQVWSRPELLVRLLRLRDSRKAKAFREWFHASAAGLDDIALAREWLAVVQSESYWSRTPVKLMRFCLGIALSVLPGIGPALGVGAGAVDSFLVDSAAKRRHFKTFLTDARQVFSLSQAMSRTTIENLEKR